MLRKFNFQGETYILLLIFLVTKKLKKSIFEIPLIAQILNIIN